MKRHIFLITALLTFVSLISCSDDNEVMYEKNAILKWTGDYDVDGCGFFIEIDSVDYKPENEGIISKEYKVNESLSVTVQYIDLLYDIEYYCGDSPNKQKAKAIKLTFLDLN
jgi:hypothetical protein